MGRRDAPGRKLSGAAAAVAAAVLAAACGDSPHKVEVLHGPRGDRVVVRVAASDEARDVFSRIAGEYAVRRGVHFEIVEVHSESAVEMLEKGGADVGVVSRRTLRGAAKGSLNYIPFAYDGVVFLAAPEARVRALSVAQLRGILEGRIRNWKEVGGADAEIRVIDRPPYSSTRLAVASALFGGTFPSGKGAFALETSDSVYHALRSIRSYLAYAPMSRTIVEQFPTVALTVEGMPPLLSRVPFQKYPAPLEYGIVFRKEVPGAVADFIDYVSSVEGMHMLASFGVAPAPGKLSLSACHCRETESTFVPARKSAMAGLLTIAIVPELGAIEQESRYAAVARLISDRLGVKTQIRHLDTYDRVLEEFAQGRVDAAFVGSLVYGKLHERFGAVPVARPERKGVSRYRGVLVVRADSGIRDLQGLKGRSLAYVPATTAGELYPLLLTAQAGGPAAWFSRLVRAPSHSEAVVLVADGRVDAAAVKDLVVERMTAGSARLRERIRVLSASESVPENALVVSPSLDPRLRAGLLDVLVSAQNTEEGRRALRAVGADRFVPTSHDDYANLYAMARQAGYSFARK